ncbi:MAG: M23 family metallopeptidase, partial [Deltaproteobacteria bacterium]|nr:M23 family metallopeptidase [Deltaproteobacteria bacterium]
MRVLLLPLLALLMVPPPATAADWDLEPSTTSWPLCGRITANPPPGWTPPDGCPADRVGSLQHTDLPLSSPYGPRLRDRSGGRYDFHRGLDFPADCGTPVFAVADGEVVRAGNDSAFDDQVVQIAHSNGPDCSGGCYFATYLHLAGAAVEEDDLVVGGQLVGWTGYNDIGDDDSASVAANCAQPHNDHEHLHFEIRESPVSEPNSSWSRYAVHPSEHLPHDDATPLSVTIDQFDADTAESPLIAVTVSQANTGLIDLEGVTVDLFSMVDDEPSPILQPGDSPDANGYLALPSSYGAAAWNLMWTHQDNDAQPWESFVTCPFVADHESSYSSNVHMEARLASDSPVGSFNGVLIEPEDYEVSATEYAVSYTFTALEGAPSKDTLCVQATAIDARGATWQTELTCPWYEPPDPTPPPADDDDSAPAVD